MSITTTAELRAAFLEFFAQKGHQTMPSSSLVPVNDPTLMFTNAGMVPFKHVFSGAEKLTDGMGQPITRACSTQKCLRAGGKHNDLDNVGYTARHHTFFEMLGNFSFGDYFKEDAIAYAWEFLTEVVGLDKDRLYFTVYHTDDEAFDLWKQTAGCDDARILRVPTNDNFWSMGDTGPCGPCSEVFYDHGTDAAEGEWALDAEGNDLFGDRYIEIWNLVFMQYEQLEGGERINLPKPCIDTGMGLERMAAVLQGVHNNYDIELFQHLVSSSQHATGNAEDGMLPSHRVIADHLRACSFLLAEGVRPSNEGRGYVLRRIMRRAMRHAHLLGAEDPVMYKLVPALVEKMGSAFPELVEKQTVISEQLKLEEERFKQTLERGLKLLEDESVSLESGDELPGDLAFKLYDTYGFPLDLTQDILRARDISVDVDGFNAAMQEQKARARAAWKGSGDAGVEELWLELTDQHGATEFLGYETLKGRGNIVALVKDGQLIEQANAGETIALVTNQTPFYGESGGQAGDKGVITSDGLEIIIHDTQKPGGKLHVHYGEIRQGAVTIGQEVELSVNATRRDAIRANHSATHLLHAALRHQLGEHVVQKGSLVEADYLRFDFAHDKSVTPEELASITREVNTIIRDNGPVATAVMTPDEAKEAGAVALFGEKYGDEVRVLSMGMGRNGLHYSMELCGGTHVARTGDIGLFLITRESSVSSGVRRIEAVTGHKALELALQQQTAVKAVADAVKATPDAVLERIETLQSERKSLERELKTAKQQLALSGGSGDGPAKDGPEQVGDVQFIGKVLSGVEPKELRGLVDQYKQKIKSGVVVLIADTGGKAAIVVGVTQNLTDRFNAVDLVRLGSEALGGKGGGGRPDFAQAGGSDASLGNKAMEAIKATL